MGVAEFTVFLAGEGTCRDESSGVKGAFTLLAWQIFLSVDFSQPLGKSIVATASFTVIFLLILILMLRRMQNLQLVRGTLTMEFVKDN